jgi:hypothetical protein
VLIKKASVDPTFRQVLLEGRAEAAHEIGLELSPAEVATLNSVPSAQIEKIIENTTVPDAQRRAFLGQVGTVMLAALTLGLSACDNRETVIVEGTPQIVEKGIRPDCPTKQVTQARGESEQLDVSVESEEMNSVTVRVGYECAFETGQITIEFRQNPNVQGADITLKPAQSIAVSRGSGEVTFHASGTGGTTNWLVVQLRSTTEQCQQAPTSWPQRTYVPGEHVVEECVVWKIVWHPKEWQ